ncbi:cupin domain-containing protein [Pyxidicoccus parkwayensis]|uniref:Cupin domain-containing protein n=1 Tax=Pyxidicoccus parkwayensis TaxID=2813578 RepID=A0ABX7NRK5_9BACT|nr:cupin domain-containing protein [Pyxidicoccus parkwaysis]QSQ21521.1 cupin domain-containing protein [Pyxidicoccus parkwaysis]
MVDELVRRLGLAPHPEGGFYKETYRAALAVQTPRGTRSAGTAIYYLLPRGSFAAWHRVTSDEVWHFYDGHPLELLLVGASGEPETVVLGRDVTKGEQPQVVVHAGVLQAAVPRGEYTLVGCTVSPGFDFSDWEMPSADSLVARYPKHAELMRRLAKET